MKIVQIASRASTLYGLDEDGEIYIFNSFNDLENGTTYWWTKLPATVE